jgi:hypothetical protein
VADPEGRDRVLSLIDAELARLTRPDIERGGRLALLRNRWCDGVEDARSAAASSLQAIRDAYVSDALTAEAESLGLYQ